MQVPLDTDVLNAVIGDHVRQSSAPSRDNGSESTLEGYRVVDILAYFKGFLEVADSPVQLMYFYGFSQGILNRIMRKLGIDYQIPPPF